MNIQIFGKNKCFDTKKAERYFKERRVKYQMVDLLRYGLSGKEFNAVLRGVGGIDQLIDWEAKDPDVSLMKYMDDKIAKEDKVFDNPKLMRTPIVRNGKEVTVGYCPEVWAKWE
ncbi:MAG: ArsC family transcriptional regulator [Oscillospiraceae bacterium]|nr:ArsC family transcriptional regulator [Oscillospiraceae bacterium]